MAAFCHFQFSFFVKLHLNSLHYEPQIQQSTFPHLTTPVVCTQHLQTQAGTAMQERQPLPAPPSIS